MTKSYVALRVSRRALAAVALTDDTVSFSDARHLTSSADRALRAAERYLRRIMELTKPQVVVIDAPMKDGSLTERLVTMASALLDHHQIQRDAIASADLLASFGLPALRTRTELRGVVERLWPELAAVKSTVRPYVLEAAATALYAETRAALGVPEPT